jgi:hypothetical protein
MEKLQNVLNPGYGPTLTLPAYLWQCGVKPTILFSNYKLKPEYRNYDGLFKNRLKNPCTDSVYPAQ